ncbi:YraN family protein [Yoonia sp. BS5-3]|uniref:UPF0102 protein AABB29_18840 n=1 Tax=Yoonia phaeophyticola TaxID=3137369 RepID=A0ABZ2V6I3_9RHOB
MTGSVGYHAGRVAEDIVERDYLQRNCRPLARRWRGHSGEIDLILRDTDGAGLIFVEVKKSKSFGQASRKLGPRQMERICSAASEFLANEPCGQLTDLRFDVALVNGAGQVQVIENAFTGM